MFDIQDQLALNEDYVKERMTEQFNQRMKQQKYMVTLPCRHESVEMERPEDTYIECSRCYKKFLISYNAGRSKAWSVA